MKTNRPSCRLRLRARWAPLYTLQILLASMLMSIFCAVAASASAAPWVEWRQMLVRDEDPGPRLAIDIEGQVEVHIPAFLRGAGDYFFELEPAELATLRLDLSRLEGLDLAALRAHRTSRLEQLAASGEVPTRAGAVVTEFELAGVGRVTWRGLAFDAGYLGDWQLERLADLEARFTAWTHDARRRSIEQGP